VRYQRRLSTYRLFRQRLTAPLLTVELSLDGRFELGLGDADNLVQLRGTDVMWHKERLLNIALSRLPRDCRKIAWLDCDVVFDRRDWAERTSDVLDEFALAQPFQDVYEIRRDAGPEAVDPAHSDSRGHSLAYGLATGTVGVDILDQNMRLKGWNSGLAWAARRELMEKDGFYDACILGSGNRAMVCAALGQFDYALQYLQMNARWAEHYLAWASRHFHGTGGRVGFAEGAILHLWHGDPADRKYMDRHHGLKEFNFDPTSDIGIDEQGCWRWNSDKPAMHQYVRDYFAARKEDG
jgi:hypothetical protein